jgi:polyhydroxyalkanoate synthesis regulator phasin
VAATTDEIAIAAPTPPKRSHGHRGADVRDTVAEMAAKAHEISLEAGSKMAAAMKDVISAAAGLTGFAVESARDLVQYMVRRGQMTQDEADKLIREAEAGYARRKPTAGETAAADAEARKKSAQTMAAPAAAAPSVVAPPARPASPAVAASPAPAAPAKKPAPSKNVAPPAKSRPEAKKAPPPAKGVAVKGSAKSGSNKQTAAKPAAKKSASKRK